MRAESETGVIVRQINDEKGDEDNSEGSGEDWNESRVKKIARHLVWLAEIVSTIVVSTETWHEGTQWKCFRLRLWILIFSSRLLFLIPLKYISVRTLQRGEEDHPQVVKFRLWLKYLTFFWFILGQSWLYYGTCTESQLLWIYILVLIIVIYVRHGYPLLILVIICSCSPCICILRRVLRETKTASKKSLNDLETRKFDAGEVDLDSLEAPTCIICLLEYEDGDEIKILPCGHEYHSDCIDEWLGGHNRTCPTCRHDITIKFESASVLEEKSP